VGWLLRKYGMSIDNLLSCEIVTADGRVLTASHSENEDLFWALRGGGGNFGVVTSFEFQAHPVHTVLGGLLLYPRDAAVGVIRFFRDYIETSPDELTAYAALLSGPDGTALTAVIACYCGAIAEGERVLRPLRAFGVPVLDAVRPMPFPEMQSLLAPSFPDGNHNHWKSTLQQNLPDEAIARIVERANAWPPHSPPSCSSNMAAPPVALPRMLPRIRHRDLPWDILCIAQWTDPAQTTAERDWARAGEEKVRSGQRFPGESEYQTRTCPGGFSDTRPATRSKASCQHQPAPLA
jgi:hypothetical protein